MSKPKKPVRKQRKLIDLRDIRSISLKKGKGEIEIEGLHTKLIVFFEAADIDTVILTITDPKMKEISDTSEWSYEKAELYIRETDHAIREMSGQIGSDPRRP